MKTPKFRSPLALLLSFSLIVSSIAFYSLPVAAATTVRQVQQVPATVTGRIVAQDTGFGIHAARVSIRTDEEEVLSTRTDDFGFFRMDFVPEATYTIRAEHPAYIPLEETDLVVTDARTLWEGEMIPLFPGETPIEVFVEVGCVSSGIQLSTVPVLVTVTLADSTTFVYQDKTDDYGVLHLPGMPKGAYSFSINEGAERVQGWESYSTDFAYPLEGSHWVDCMLKPEYRELTALVYGYDPVKDMDNQPLSGIIVEATGVDPRDERTGVVPPQVGVSGIRKEGADNPYNLWDNSMAGKVLFEKLIPITWLVETKRMGYKPSHTFVRTLANGLFDQDEVRFDIELEPTKLMVELASEYNDPEMLVGMQVHLTGFEATNTEGIARTQPVSYDPGANRAYALFERILPGEYFVEVLGTVTKTVPILVEGVNVCDGSSWDNEPKTFWVNFAARDTFYAANAVTTTVRLDLVPEKMKLKGFLYAVDEEKTPGSFEYMHYAVSGKTVEIRASEAYIEHMPNADQPIQVSTNADGSFEVELYPGLYGVVVHDMDDYWGDAVEFSDYRFTNWPHYQNWPYSLASARAYGFIGGMTVSSSDDITATFFVRRNWFNTSIRLLADKDPTQTQVVALDRTDPESGPTVRTLPYEDVRSSGVVNLAGPDARSVELSVQDPDFVGLGPGSYVATLSHPRYVTTEPVTFAFFDFPSPGSLPATEFPADYNTANGGNPRPMLPHFANTYLQYAPQNSIQVGTMVSNLWKWQQVSSDPDIYDYVNIGRIHPNFIKPAYTGERIFRLPVHHVFGTTHPDRAYVPASEYEAWFYWPKGGWPYLGNVFGDQNEHWFKFASTSGGLLSVDIYIGGGPNDTPEAENLEITYTLVVEARDQQNPHAPPIPGVVISLSDEGPNVVSGNTYEGQSRYLSVTDATHLNWQFVGPYIDWGYTTRIDNTSETPRVVLTVYMRKGIALRGEVKNAVTGTPIKEVAWKIVKALGNEPILRQTDQDGRFEWGLANSVHFAEFEAAGYEPLRIRLDPDDAIVEVGPHTLLTHDLSGERAVMLTPLAKPVILRDTLEIDRFGSFIPGVKRAGNQQTFNASSNAEVESRLTMTWSIKAQLGSQQYTFTRPRYDTDTAPGGTEEISVSDEIAEFWIVDRKVFADRAFRERPTDLEVPSTADEQYDPKSIHDWLKSLQSGGDEGSSHVFYQKIGKEGISLLDDGVTYLLSGNTELWKLPPDDFRPTFVVITKLGAVQVYNFDYQEGTIANLPESFSVDPTLVGMRVPQWFGSFTDVMAYAAQATSVVGGAARERVQQVTPSGSILPMASFTADVVLRADKCLNYVYRLDVEMMQGSSTPSGGMLSVAPGMMGFSAFGGMEVTLKGADREFYIQAEAGLGFGKINLSKMTPSILKFLGVTPELDPMPQGRFYHIDDYFFDAQNYPTEKAVVTGGSGEVGIKVYASALEAVGKIPKVGWVLLAVKRSGLLDVGLLARGMIGVRGLWGYKTIFPQEVEHYSYMQQAAESRQLRRSFIGGLQTDNVVAMSQEVQNLSAEERAALGITEEPTSSLDICVNFGVGIYAQALGGRTGAEGSIEVAGDDGWTRRPALFIVFNTDGDAPLIRQIRGDVRASVDVFVQAWIARLQKQYVWAKIPIEYQHTTESTFHLIPLEITVTGRNRNDYEPSLFVGTPPLLVDKFLEIGEYSTDSRNSDAFLYTDMQSTGGLMRLVASKGEPQTGVQKWGAPTEVALTAGAIVSHDILLLPDRSGYMAVWTEISQEHAEQMFPPSTVKYSLSDANLQNWSEPQSVCSFDDVAAHLRLVQMGNQAALVFMSTDEGPAADNYKLGVLLWNGSEWSTPSELVSKQPMAAFGAAGSDAADSAVVVSYVNRDAEIHSLFWDGSSVTAHQKLGEDAGNDIAVVGDSRGGFYLAWSGVYQGIMFSKYDSGWSEPQDVLPEALPDTLDISLLSDESIQVVWTEDAGRKVLAATVAEDGSIVQPGALVTSVTQTAHYAVSIVSSLNPDTQQKQAYVFAKSVDAGSFKLLAHPVSGETKPGDLNSDGVVNIADIALMAQKYGMRAGATGWDDKYDLNGDGVVDLYDLVALARLIEP